MRKNNKYTLGSFFHNAHQGKSQKVNTKDRMLRIMLKYEVEIN